MRLTKEREMEIVMHSDILGHPDLMEVLDELYKLREEMSLLVSFSDKLNEARIKAEGKEKELEAIKAAARRISWNDSVYGYLVSSKEADRLLALIYPNFKNVLEPEYLKGLFEDDEKKEDK